MENIQRQVICLHEWRLVQFLKEPHIHVERFREAIDRSNLFKKESCHGKNSEGRAVLYALTNNRSRCDDREGHLSLVNHGPRKERIMTKRLPCRSPLSCIREHRQRGSCTPCRVARVVLESSCRQKRTKLRYIIDPSFINIEKKR